MTNTNSFTAESAQGAAAVSTYQVGAIVQFLDNNDSAPYGIVCSHPSESIYGVLFVDLNSNSPATYRYLLVPEREITDEDIKVSPLEEMQLRIARMVIKKPIAKVEYTIINQE